MSYDLYKKIAVSMIAGLDSKENAVVGVSSSNTAVDTCAVSYKIAESFLSMGMSVSVMNPFGFESQKPAILDKATIVVLKQEELQNLNPLKAKELIDGVKSTVDITVIPLENVATSVQSMMLAQFCDGIALAERKKSSRTDRIDQSVDSIKNLCVKPLGFILD